MYVLVLIPRSYFLNYSHNLTKSFLQDFFPSFLLTVESDDIDPLCKLILGNGQHLRFCVAISTSSYFEYIIRYPYGLNFACFKEKVSFKTTEAIAEAAGKSYYERMIRCRSTYIAPLESDTSFLFISRAYLSNAVFVYRENPIDKKIYLENLSTNVSIVDEINSFDFVEY